MSEHWLKHKKAGPSAIFFNDYPVWLLFFNDYPNSQQVPSLKALRNETFTKATSRREATDIACVEEYPKNKILKIRGRKRKRGRHDRNVSSHTKNGKSKEANKPLISWILCS